MHRQLLYSYRALGDVESRHVEFLITVFPHTLPYVVHKARLWKLYIANVENISSEKIIIISFHYHYYYYP